MGSSISDFCVKEGLITFLSSYKPSLQCIPFDEAIVTGRKEMLLLTLPFIPVETLNQPTSC